MDYINRVKAEENKENDPINHKFDILFKVKSIKIAKKMPFGMDFKNDMQHHLDRTNSEN